MTPDLPPTATFDQWWTSAPSAVWDFTRDFLNARDLSHLEDIPPADWQDYADGAKAVAKAPRPFAPRPAPKPSLPGNPVDLISGERL